MTNDQQQKLHDLFGKAVQAQQILLNTFLMYDIKGSQELH